MATTYLAENIVGFRKHQPQSDGFVVVMDYIALLSI